MLKIFKNIQYFPLLIILFLSFISIITIYSLNGGEFYHPRFIKHLARLFIGFIILILTSSIDLNLLRKYAYSLYLFNLILLLLVEIIGKTVMGAQRWLDLYFISIQPSEVMKISLIIIIAKYLSTLSIDDIKSTKYIIIPTILTLIPAVFVLHQPDLGTAMLLILVYCSMLLIAGIQIWKLLLLPTIGICATPIIWSLLHAYQKDRILMFLNPETDPSGAGYHIIQSKIALGSGGIFGKGFIHGSQCQLGFLPEKSTDFIFATIGEKFGFFGCLILIILYSMLLVYNYNIALKSQNKFKRYLVFGLNTTLFFYIFINIAMVCGLLPIVGIPLPFLSYGGTAIIILMFSEGVIIAASINKN